MASKAIYFVLLIVALDLVVDNVEAGWKFWEKKDDGNTSTTVYPEVADDPQVGGEILTVDGSNLAAGPANPAPAAGNKPVTSSTGGNAPGASSTGTWGAIAGAGNPGLVIGVGNTGENIRNNARPQRPNPGTEVGLDISGPRPAGRPGTGGKTGQGYRDWAIALTGAGEGSRQPPKLPSQGPALSPDGFGQQQPGIRPESPSSPAPGGQQQPEARPGSPVTSGAATVGIPHRVTTPNGKVYYSNPSYNKGNAVTNDELEKLSESLFIKDIHNANKYITLNLQNTTTSQNPVDQASQPLLKVNEQFKRIPTIDSLLQLYDNYHSNQSVPEQMTPQQLKEESRLIDTFLTTDVMSTAMRFLAEKNFIPKSSDEHKSILQKIWFTLYSRGNVEINSSGFEHVFLTEEKFGKRRKVGGLHNWIYYDNEERKGRVNYLGYMKKVDLGNKAAILMLHAKIHDIIKPVTSMFIGTSPELEMALYTVCFFTRPNRPCPVSLGGTMFKIQTYKLNYKGKVLIGSAYPTI